MHLEPLVFCKVENSGIVKPFALEALAWQRFVNKVTSMDLHAWRYAVSAIRIRGRKEGSCIGVAVF